MSVDSAQNVAQLEAKWPYRTTFFVLVAPGIAIWTTVITACVYWL